MWCHYFEPAGKTSTLAGEAPRFVLTEEIQSHKQLPLKWCWLHCVTSRNPCFWTASHITLIADVAIKCFKSCIWKWRTSMWLNTLTSLSCWRSVLSPYGHQVSVPTVWHAIGGAQTSCIQPRLIALCCSHYCSDPNSEILGSVPEYRPLTRESGPCRLRVIAHDESPLLSW